MTKTFCGQVATEQKGQEGRNALSLASDSLPGAVVRPPAVASCLGVKVPTSGTKEKQVLIVLPLLYNPTAF